MCIVKNIAKQAVATFNNKQSNASFQLQLEKLVSLTQQVKAADLGLEQKPNENESLQARRSSAPVTFISICEETPFTLGVFIIRKGCSIPLHDHPGMIGICKLLYGAMKVTSYDPIATKDRPALCNHERNLIPVKKRSDREICNPSKCEILTPARGSFHSLSAIKDDAAIFDILAPPYSDDRDCSYYRELSDEEQLRVGFHRSDHEKVEGLTLLEEIPTPSNFYCDSKPYKGSPID